MPAGKKNCYGCRALNFRASTGDCARSVRCILGYQVELIDSAPLLPTPVPVNKSCPKPRTHSELDRLLKEKLL